MLTRGFKSVAPATSEAVPFVYLASVCRSLQCLISALTRAGGGGLLFRFACSVVLWGRGALQTRVTGLCGEHSRFSGHTGFAPAHGCVCFPHLHCSGSRLLSRERALRCVDIPGVSRSDSGFRVLHKSTDLVGPEFCAFPGRSSLGSQDLGERSLPGCRASSPLHGPSVSFLARQSGAPCVSSGELASSCNPPGGCRPSKSQGSLWLEAGSLFAVW